MQFYTAADQVAAGRVQLSTIFTQSSPALPLKQCREIVISVSGTGPVRFGDVGVASNVGLQCPSGVSPTVLRTTVGDVTDWFDLSTVWIFVPSGTTASIIVGK